jgi:hypothetical protein
MLRRNGSGNVLDTPCRHHRDVADTCLPIAIDDDVKADGSTIAPMLRLLSLVRHERAARAAAGPAEVWLQLMPGEDAAAKLAAERAAGRIGPSTAVNWIRHVIVDPTPATERIARDGFDIDATEAKAEPHN